MHSFSKHKCTKSKNVQFVGAAIKSGQDIDGVDQAPKALRQSGLFQSLQAKFNVKTKDNGDISLASLSEEQVKSPEYKSHVKNLHLLDPMLKMVSKKVESIVEEDKEEESIVLTIGGDHSIATGSIHGMLTKYKDLKVIWVDAHPDFIDCSQSKYEGYHGMPLSHLAGINDSYIEGFDWLVNKVPHKNIVLIGIRDIDEDQWISLKKYNIKCFTPDHIEMYGIGKVMEMAIEYLDPKTGQNHKSAPFHISFDIDAMDPSIAQGTGTKFRDGLNHREGCHIVRRVAHERKLVGMDIVEINPKLQENFQRRKYRGEDLHKQIGETVGLGIDLVESMFTEYLTL